MPLRGGLWGKRLSGMADAFFYGQWLMPYRGACSGKAFVGNGRRFFLWGNEGREGVAQLMLESQKSQKSHSFPGVPAVSLSPLVSSCPCARGTPITH